MKKVLTFVLSILMLGLSSYAQNINRVDKKGWKQGKWEQSYSNGALRYRGQFRNNEPYGEFRNYYPTGGIKSISQYKDSGIEVYVSSFHLNGKPLATGKFVRQKKDSIWNYFSDLDGKRVASESYHDGRKEGRSIIFYPESGKPVEVTTYKNGLKTGPWRKYFPDGTLSQMRHYVQDTLQGDFQVNSIQGKILIKGSYKKGFQDGLWITYDSLGNPIKQTTYHRGIPVKTKEK